MGHQSYGGCKHDNSDGDIDEDFDKIYVSVDFLKVPQMARFVLTYYRLLVMTCNIMPFDSCCKLDHFLYYTWIFCPEMACIYCSEPTKLLVDCSYGGKSKTRKMSIRTRRLRAKRRMTSGRRRTTRRMRRWTTRTTIRRTGRRRRLRKNTRRRRMLNRLHRSR